ncbi:hypothetical protein [uncultured Cyclobacterium sp.]|uniref:hypothetical protein n=1 Tax=uncultured Cyclobacterium sp. TaxID=453820 RepID=UPI0030EDB5D0
MKNSQLRMRINFCVILLIFASCVEEPCLDIPELERRLTDIKEWEVKDTIGNQTIIDSNGIPQTLIMSSLDSFYHENIVEDDCGNIFGSYYFSIQYNTSFSPLHLMVDIQGSGISEDGYNLRLTVTNTNGVSVKSSTYDFVTETSRDDNAVITTVEGFQSAGILYSDVLKFTFKDSMLPNEIKTVYYAKGQGIVKFSEQNGNEFVISNA